MPSLDQREYVDVSSQNPHVFYCTVGHTVTGTRRCGRVHFWASRSLGLSFFITIFRHAQLYPMVRIAIFVDEVWSDACGVDETDVTDRICDAVQALNRELVNGLQLARPTRKPLSSLLRGPRSALSSFEGKSQPRLWRDPSGVSVSTCLCTDMNSAGKWNRVVARFGGRASQEAGAGWAESRESGRHVRHGAKNMFARLRLLASAS